LETGKEKEECFLPSFQRCCNLQERTALWRNRIASIEMRYILGSLLKKSLVWTLLCLSIARDVALDLRRRRMGVTDFNTWKGYNHLLLDTTVTLLSEHFPLSLFLFSKTHRGLLPTLLVAAYACRPQQGMLDCAKPWFAKEVWISGGMCGIWRRGLGSRR
jgi:hypothetical protein